MTLARKLTGTADSAIAGPIPILRGLWQQQGANQYTLTYGRPHAMNGAPLEILARVHFDADGWHWEVQLAHRSSGVTRMGDVALTRRNAITRCEAMIINHAWR